MSSLRLGSKIPCLLLVPPYLMMSMSCPLEANLKLLVLPETCCLIEAAVLVVVLNKIWYQMPMSGLTLEVVLSKNMAEAVVQIGNSVH